MKINEHEIFCFKLVVSFDPAIFEMSTKCSILISFLTTIP